MSRVQSLINSRDSLSVKFLEFTRIVSKGCFAAFFEGDDEKYYSVRINTIRPDVPWRGVNCKGKSNVVAMRARIRRHPSYGSHPCLFFIDSDFEENKEISGLEDVYLTPCYSVENLYISDSAFSRILSAEFGVSDSCEERNCFDQCMSIYSSIKAMFIEEITGFNYLINEIYFIRKEEGVNISLNINNLSIDDLVDVDLFSVSKNYDEFSPRSIFPDFPEGMNVSFERPKKFFAERNEEDWYRGKQNLDFLRVFLTKLKSDRVKRGEREVFSKKGKVKIQLTKSNLVSELSQYADTPACLKSFLEKIDVDSLVA